MKILNKKAISIIEYSLLFMIIIGAYLVMKQYIQNGFNNNLAQTGQSFAFGRQYDPQKTIECSYDAQSNQWYDRNCYKYYLNSTPSACTGDGAAQCSGDAGCEECVITGYCSAGSGSYCIQLNNGGGTL